MHTVISGRSLAGVEGRAAVFFDGEKCRSALGTERMLEPSRALGTSILSAPSATDRRGEDAADGWWLTADGWWLTGDG
ncbi:MAG: hypothetical protein RLZZ450_6675 [Pseudomonadota bacterium]|jgi:hypothetical protein